MKTITQKYCPKANIKIKPFLPLLPQAHPKATKDYKFTYVGSLSINKGLPNFLKALEDLDKSLKSKIKVSVVLNNTLEEANQSGLFTKSLLNITLDLKCRVGREELSRIYEASEFLVVTSLYESFYLPAYEAIHFGCKVIASKNVGYLSHLHDSKDFIFYSGDDLDLTKLSI